tara:strand:- start:1152 stop:1655 length:504 start_codon:yes stop_codon:yes gene_type:complete
MGFSIWAVEPQVKQPHFENDDADVWSKYFDKCYVTPGEYFSVNSWGWRPIPALLHRMGQIPDDELQSWGYNDGYIIEEKRARKIGLFLTNIITSAATTRGIKKADYKEYCFNMDGRLMSWTEWEMNKVDWYEGMPRRDWDTHYAIGLNMLMDFAVFCVNCVGGFKIQ